MANDSKRQWQNSNLLNENDRHKTKEAGEGQKKSRKEGTREVDRVPMFRSPREAPKHIEATDSFKRYVDYYTQRVSLTENKLALCIRQNQQRLNKISNGKLKNVDVETLVRICLVLGLSEEESVDLMARRERALSPAEPVHQVYRELIRWYSTKSINYRAQADKLAKILDEADRYLQVRGFEPFENKNI